VSAQCLHEPRITTDRCDDIVRALQVLSAVDRRPAHLSPAPPIVRLILEAAVTQPLKNPAAFCSRTVELQRMLSAVARHIVGRMQFRPAVAEHSIERRLMNYFHGSAVELSD
jgi:hypothetical protein